MTPRPGFVSKRRPLSAIFLGDSASTPSPSNLPDLPEPPSPSAESDHSYASGLPSPPATNSTGSGGDKSADGGSVRRRSVSDTIANMPKPYDSISSTNIRHSRSSSPGDDEEGNEDDSTARFDHLRRRSSQTSAENAATLQRVLSLTQRNRMALDKLSRLNTPSPSGRQSRSPLPPLTGPSPASSSTSSSSSASSRQSAHSHSRSFPTTRDHDPGLSGSETERDRQSYSSDEVSSTPPSTISRRTDPRARTTSMPDSPQRRRSRSRASSPGPSATIQRTPRKRVSLASEPDSNVTHAALAAVASMRRSPTQGLGGRSRQPLPKEFFDAKRRSSDGRTSKEPTTPQKASYRALANSPSPRLVNPPLRDSSLQVSPHRGQPRFSTVRELSHKHQIRWQSEDLNAHGYNDEMTTTGRRQYQRAGSMENTLGARLVGDSLRAAGIGMRKEGGGEVFSSGHTQQSQSSDSDPWYEGSENRVRNGPSRASSILSDPRTPANRESRSRPPTSMADTADIAPRTAPPGVRTYKATFLERNREGIGSARASPRPSEDSPTPLRTPQFAERTYGSPRPRSRDFSATEHSGNNGRQSSMADEQPIEHLKLVSEALTVFETQLSRLPLMGDTTTATVPNLFRDAQAIVRSAEQVNSMLRIGTNRALERQIDSEVDEEDSGAIDMVQLWQDVGADFRDCLRSSDELVRTLANFLVGAGKVLREATAVSNGPGMQQHLRAASLDAGGAAIVNGNDARSSTASGSGKSSARSSGLRAESRLSWEATRDIKRNSSRAEHRSSLQLRERDTNIAYTPESEAPPQPAISPRPSLTSSSSMRRIHSPRLPEAGDTSLEYDGVDPSPTPPARHQSSATTERLRGLAPIAIPQQAEPESNSAQTPLNRRTTVPDRSINRRKASNTSNITIRPVPTFAVPPTPSATTALTPATASSNRTPNRTSVPVQRSTLDGANSSKKPGIGVTLSRAASAVQRKRTTSSTSPAEVSDQHAYAATPVYGKPVRAGREEESRSASRTTFGRRSASIVASAGVPATVGRTIGSERKERRRTITEIFSS